jgi:hypothetical protein
MRDRRNQLPLQFETREAQPRTALFPDGAQPSQEVGTDEQIIVMDSQDFVIGSRKVVEGSMEHFDLMRRGFTEKT